MTDIEKEKYIVIKVSAKNWIEQEKAKAKIKWYLGEYNFNFDIDFVDVEYIGARQCANKEELVIASDIEEYIRKNIAVSIGEFLLDKDLISFCEKDEKHIKEITGKIAVIKE